MSRHRPSHSAHQRQVIGWHSAMEVLKVNLNDVTEIWVTKAAAQNLEREEVYKGVKSSRLPVVLKPEAVIEKIGRGHQGIAVQVASKPEVDLSQILTKTPCQILILDEISDPQNLGNMLRTAWLAGVSAIFTTERRSASLTPTVMKIASGGAEHVPVESIKNIGQFVSQLKEAGFWIYGLDGASKSRVWQQEFADKTALLVGSEERGLRKSVRENCDALISLPQVTHDSSYNAATATAMVLSELLRQRQST